MFNLFILMLGVFGLFYLLGFGMGLLSLICLVLLVALKVEVRAHQATKKRL